MSLSSGSAGRGSRPGVATMDESTFEHAFAWGFYAIGIIVLVAPAMVHRRLRQGKRVDVGVWGLIGLHQPEPGRRRSTFRGCTNWHVGWAHTLWWLYFILAGLVWVALRLFGLLHK